MSRARKFRRIWVVIAEPLKDSQMPMLLVNAYSTKKKADEHVKFKEPIFGRRWKYSIVRYVREES